MRSPRLILPLLAFASAGPDAPRLRRRNYDDTHRGLTKADKIEERAVGGSYHYKRNGEIDLSNEGPETTVKVDLSVNGKLLLDGEELHPLAAVVVYNLDSLLVGSDLIADISEEELRSLELESLDEALTELGVDPDHVLGGNGESVRLDGIYELVYVKLTAKLESRRAAMTIRQADVTAAEAADGTEFCSFCPGGLDDPVALLPGKNAPSCQQAQTFATRLEVTDPQCSQVLVAESTCCPAGAAAEEEEAPAAVATEAPPAEEDTNACLFCPGGIPDPDATLEKVGKPEQTCSEASAFASVLVKTDGECSRVRNGMLVCCPDQWEEEPAKTTTTTTTVTTTAATTVATTTTPEECVCSPRKYRFRLSLTQLCDVDDLEDGPGIGLTLCVLHVHQERSLDLLRSNNGVLALDDPSLQEYEFRTKADERALPGHMRVSSHQLHKMSVIDIQFLEFGNKGDVTVINQDDSYSDVDLKNGDLVEFDSISNLLSPDEGLGDQSEYVPGGVQITIRGRVVDHGNKNNSTDAGKSRIVNQRVTWSYTNGCDAVPVNDGDRIGWVTFVSWTDDEACRTEKSTLAARAYWLTIVFLALFLSHSIGESETRIAGLLPRRRHPECKFLVVFRSGGREK